jgi:hypothetical protein
MAMAPANYSGLANLMNLQGVGVNPTSQLAYVPSTDLMTRYQTIPNPRTGIPQAVGVTGMAEGGMPSQQYPMQEEAMELANRGRYGDTTLVHMTPEEVRGLASLGELTINPETGLPEAFSLKSLIPAIAGIAGAILFPPAAAALGATSLGTGFMGAAIGSGLGTTVGSLAIGKSTGDALLSGLMSFGTGAIMGGFSGVPAFGDAAGAALPAGVDPVGNLATAVDDSVLTGLQTATPSGTALSGSAGITQQTFDLTKALPAEKGFLGTSLGAKPEIPIGQAPRSEILARGFQPADITIPERAGQIFSKPSTYASAGLTALTSEEPYEPPPMEPLPEPETGFGTRQLVGGEVIRPPKTSQEILDEMTSGGYTRRFTPYRYAAEGGLVGLQQGGMPMAQPQMQMPQQQQQPTSAMAAMVQPVPQPQPQQQMPTSTPEAVQPFDPMQQYRQAYMEVEGERSRKNTASALQQVSALGAMAQQVLQQDKALQGVTPQKPYVPPTNYGSQVNLGAGFNQGGLIRLSEGGQSKYFEGQVEVENGDGMSDEVLFDVEGDNPDMALLSRDEYVLPADVVAMIGNGSSNAGADKLDDFVKDIREVSFGTRKQQKQMNAEKGLQTLVS